MLSPVTLLIIGIGVVAGWIFISNLFKKEDPPVPEYMRDFILLHIAVPKYNEKNPLAAEQMFASLHGILRGNKRSVDFLSFEFASNQSGVQFYAVTPAYLEKFVKGQIYAQYPDAEISVVSDYADTRRWSQEGIQSYVSSAEVELSKDFIFPIKTFRDFEVDPLASITSAMAKLDKGEEVWSQIIIRPVADYWQDICKEYIGAVKEGKDPTKISAFRSGVAGPLKLVLGVVGDIFASSPSADSPKEVVRLAPGQEEELAQIAEKMTKSGFEVGIRVVAKAYDQISAENLMNDVVAAFKQFTTAHLNSFQKSENDGKNSIDILHDYQNRFLADGTVDILNLEELASVYHLPNVSVETPNIVWSGAKKAEPPLNLPIEQGTIFAETNYRGNRVKFGIKKEDRRRHFYLLGKTGTGKSTLFKNMIVSDILAGEGIVVLDPHGDLVEWILDYIPDNRVDDVVYLDPSDTERPISINMLELGNPDLRDLVADGIVDVFKKQFGDSWGPRLHYILYNAISTLLEAQGETLLGVQRLLLDKGYRNMILQKVKDPVLLGFWNEEYSKMQGNSRLVTEAIAPIQNKVGRFLSSSTIRNMIGQVHSTIDTSEIINSRKIFLVNLSQGKIGEESSALLGGMIVTRLQSAAMQRVNISEDSRADCFLYVDEFQNFATESFSKILSEARKYRLNLNVTHQYIAQLTPEVKDAVFGNVGTLATYVVGPQDATDLAVEFSPVFSEEDVATLDRYQMYLKLMIDGQISAPFSANALNIRYAPNANRTRVVQASREKYGTEKSVVEQSVNDWATQQYSEKGNVSRHRPDQERGGVPDKPPPNQEKPQDKPRGKGKSKQPKYENMVWKKGDPLPGKGGSTTNPPSIQSIPTQIPPQNISQDLTQGQSQDIPDRLVEGVTGTPPAPPLQQ